MLWLYISIGAYALFAVNAVIDRYLLAGPLPHPRLYAFYSGIFGIVAIVLIPFGFTIVSLPVIALSLSTGAIGLFALFLFYRAIFYGRASTVVPSVGALSPIFTLLFSFIFFGNRLGIVGGDILALAFLIGGTFLLSLRIDINYRVFVSFKDLKNILYTAVLFGLSLALTKLVFEFQPFISGFIWLALGGFLASFVFLAASDTRKRVFAGDIITKRRVSLPFFIGKGIGAIGSLLKNYAIYIATIVQVTFINALSGTQYFFLLLFVIFFAFKNPRLLKEQLNKKSLPFRVGGAALIIVGLLLLI